MLKIDNRDRDVLIPKSVLKYCASGAWQHDHYGTIVIKTAVCKLHRLKGKRHFFHGALVHNPFHCTSVYKGFPLKFHA